MTTERAKKFIDEGIDIYQPNSAVDSDKQKVFW
jgi:hypothetical protein